MVYFFVLTTHPKGIVLGRPTQSDDEPNSKRTFLMAVLRAIVSAKPPVIRSSHILSDQTISAEFFEEPYCFIKITVYVK